ncbi:protein G12-like [Lasioglossum baleicum]|uniref:protein G12-like n=1 Tax=Lasioglossum baleicum TaxID=434251 RepID=UPI003FCEB1DE
MKFVLAALAVLAVSTPINAYKLPRTGSGALADTLQDFMDVIPTDKIVSLIIRYIAEDREFGTLVSYLKDKEFKSLIHDTEAIPEVVSLLNYIQKGGLDVYYLVNKLNKFLGLPSLKAPNTYQLYKISGGIRGFLDDVEALIPVSKLKAIYKQKMATSQVFIDLMARIRSPDMQKIANAVAANPNLNAILNKAAKAGIDNKAVVEFLERFLGIHLPIDV